MRELVTIASFSDSVQAAFARNILEEAGVQAFLADEAMVSMAWYLAGALAGIKLQVAAEDVQRARAVLAESAGDVQRSPDWIEEEEEEATSREQNAQRALKAAVFGLLFCPLELYAFWLLLKVVFSDERLADKPRRCALLAAVFNLPFMALIVLLLRLICVD